MREFPWNISNMEYKLVNIVTLIPNLVWVTGGFKKKRKKKVSTVHFVRARALKGVLFF